MQNYIRNILYTGIHSTIPYMKRNTLIMCMNRNTLLLAYSGTIMRLLSGPVTRMALLNICDVLLPTYA